MSNLLHVLYLDTVAYRYGYDRVEVSISNEGQFGVTLEATVGNIAPDIRALLEL